jgi:hypothetical protein
VIAAPATAAPARPDLGVRSLSVPATASAGSAIEARLAVRNAGRRPAKRTTVTFHLSANRKLDKRDTRLQTTAAVKALKRGKSRSVKVRLAIPGTTKSGAYFLLACADGTRRLRERKEGNNCRGRALRVGAPVGPLPGPLPPVTPGGASGPVAGPGPADPPPVEPEPVPVNNDVDPNPSSGAGPEPESVASPVDPTGTATGLGDSVEFLFSGPAAVQKGVEDGTIKETNNEQCD